MERRVIRKINIYDKEDFLEIVGHIKQVTKANLYATCIRNRPTLAEPVDTLTYKRKRKNAPQDKIFIFQMHAEDRRLNVASQYLKFN